MKTFVVGDVHGRREQLKKLLEMLPRDEANDSLIFLGDYIDRGTDAPGVVSDVVELQREQPERVICLRGNHEQMLLDFLDDGAPLWLSPVTGGHRTYEQYTGASFSLSRADDLLEAQRKIEESLPAEHLSFFRTLPYYHEDDYALYVHAGLDGAKHPRETEQHSLLWSRDMEFFKNYRGKPCLFGHTPTAFLPLRGRVGRHGIYIFHNAIGLDTGYNYRSPLSCLELPEFNLYQTFADGHQAKHHIKAFISEPLSAMRKSASSKTVN
jgi:serine/threonine protein phosphatase 1